MNYSVKSILLTSLTEIRFWLPISLAGFIIGVSFCVICIWANQNAVIIALDGATINTNTSWEMAGLIITKLIKVLLVIIICLLVTSNKYGTAVGKVLTLFISAYLGVILVLFIKSESNNYLNIIYPYVNGFSILWCLSIGTLKTKLNEKIKLAVMPFLLWTAVSICQEFF